MCTCIHWPVLVAVRAPLRTRASSRWVQEGVVVGGGRQVSEVAVSWAHLSHLGINLRYRRPG